MPIIAWVSAVMAAVISLCAAPGVSYAECYDLIVALTPGKTLSSLHAGETLLLPVKS